MEETAYRQFIELEDEHFWFVGRRRIFMHLLGHQLAGREDARILDVGCGAGGMLGPLASFGRVSGLDTSEELVGFCRQRGFERVRTASAYEIPEKPGSFDLVTLFDTIEHVPDDVRALRECRRVLAGGGLLFASVPAYQFLFANNDRIAQHQRRYTAKLMRSRLLEAGLEPIRTTYFNTLLFPAILPTVLLKKARESFSAPDDSTNLSHRIPPPLNRALAATMSAERHLLSRISMPFGHSLIAIARAPSAPAGQRLR